MNKKAAASMLEIVIILTIVTALSAVSVIATRNPLKDSKTKSVTLFLRTLGSDFESAFVDGYNLRDYVIQQHYRASGGTDTENDTLEEKYVKAFLKYLAKNYLHADFNYDTLVIQDDGIKINMLEKDPWQNPYTVFYQASKSYSGDVIIVSAGEDRKLSLESYLTGNIGDDKVLSITFNSQAREWGTD